MKINGRILNISAWLALFTLIFFPGREIMDGAPRTEYGFPLRYFIQYHEISDSKWLASSVNIQLLYYCFNVLIFYGVFLALAFIRNKMRLGKNNKK